MGRVDKMDKNRFFLDIEKEAQWLNEMAMNGYRLVDRTLWTYHFIPCEKGEYSYCVEPRLFIDPIENRRYRDFLKEVEVEMVTRHWGKYYFEKEADGKLFEIYTDQDSKIQFYKRQLLILSIIALIDMGLLYDQWIELTGPWILGCSLPCTIQLILMLGVVLTGVKCLTKIVQLKYQLKRGL